MESVKELGSLKFGVYSPDEIKRMSVCKIHRTINSKKKGELTTEDDIALMNFDTITDVGIEDFLDKNTIGTEYDERMGPLRKGHICVTCKKDYNICPGHFGHIELYTPVLHPLYIKEIANFLSCICHKCYRLLITKEQLYILGFLNYRDHFRYSKIVEKTKKMGICFRCNTPCPKIVTNKNDCVISFVLKERGQNTISTIVSTETIQKIFNNIPDKDIKIMGFDPKFMHPRNLIMTNFPVLPICSRSPVFIDGKMGDDDLTVQICEIIKLNNSIGKTLLEPVTEVDKNSKKLNTLIQSLKFRIQTYMNNNHDKAKNPTNSRPIKAINQRIKGKSGLIRNNIMGKRTDQSARTVIGPDSTLRIDEVAVPLDICKNLTVPERVTDFNIEYLTKLIEEGKTHIIIKGDKKFYSEYLLYNYNKYTKLQCWDVIERGGKKIIVRNPSEYSLIEGDVLFRNDKKIDIIPKMRKKINFRLEPGDIVERHLKEGDIVVLNRQPSLWKGSMIGLRVIPKEGKTIRFNLAICKSLNADYDG